MQERTSALTLLTAQDLAAEFQVAKATIYRWVRDQGLPGIKLHDKADLRFRPEDVERWLDSRKVMES
jgi:excisionase family DNA binding protein